MPLTDAELDKRFKEITEQLYSLSIPLELQMAGKDSPDLNIKERK